MPIRYTRIAKSHKTGSLWGIILITGHVVAEAQLEKSRCPLDPHGDIKTYRITNSVALVISWKLSSGRSCSADARTNRISREGATIALAHELASGQEIRVRRQGGGDEAVARVAGFIEKKGGWSTFGVVFTESSENFWGADWHEGVETEGAPVRINLECAACQARAAIELNEIQTEVFMTRGIISLSCDHCASWTVWALATKGAPSTSETEKNKKPLPASKKVADNRRKHLRVATKVMACVSFGGFPDEIVRVRDASRGGFRFISSNVYPEGAILMVAVPYTRDSANVFVPASIMWRRELTHLDRREYGVAYNETGKGSPKLERDRSSGKNKTPYYSS